MGVLALVFGILAMLGLMVAFIPCLGWLNWINVPFAILGAIFSAIAMSRPAPARDKGIAGLVMSLIAIVLGLVRLVLGGGIL